MVCERLLKKDSEIVSEPKVIFVYKRFGQGGYYIDCATKALVQQGINVTIEPTITFTHLWTTQPDTIFHLHFPEELYKSETILGLLRKSVKTLALLMLLKIRGTRIVWTLHDEVPHESAQWHWVDTLMRKTIARLCSVVFVHNHYAANALREQYSKATPTILVPHGNYIKFYPNSSVLKEDARRVLKIKQNAFVYLFFGRIRWYKGLENLIQTFRNLEEPDSKLILAGFPAGIDWNQKKTRLALQKKIKGDKRIVTRFEWVPKEEVAYYFKAADVAVFPFRRITTSGSVVTALSFGKPIVAPALGGMPELVDTECGILYNPHDPRGLAVALQAIRKCDLQSMSRAALAKAHIQSWEEFANKTATIYKAIYNGSLEVLNSKI